MSTTGQYFYKAVCYFRKPVIGAIKLINLSGCKPEASNLTFGLTPNLPFKVIFDVSNLTSNQSFSDVSQITITIKNCIV